MDFAVQQRPPGNGLVAELPGGREALGGLQGLGVGCEQQSSQQAGLPANYLLMTMRTVAGASGARLNFQETSFEKLVDSRPLVVTVVAAAK
jgi:hypothetical protein